MSNQHTLSRRSFLGMLAAGGSALVSGRGIAPARAEDAASRAMPVMLPVRRDVPESAQVAFVKTHDRAEGVRRALELFGQNPVAGKQVVLKPNFNSADPPPGATHNVALAALVTWVQDSGADRITVGDRSWAGGRSVMQAKGIYDMAAQMGFETQAFDDLPADADNWQWVQPELSHWQYGFLVARPIWEAESVVATCCLKTHGYGGHYTISLKNAVGIVAKAGPCGDTFVRLMDELHAERSRHMRQMIAEINLAWSPDIYVVDAVEAFVAGGPMTGTLAQTGAVFVGTDRVALDAIGVALLRKFGAGGPVREGRIFETGQIARAVELGIGIDAPDKIEFLTDDAESAAYVDAISAFLFDEA